MTLSEICTARLYECYGENPPEQIRLRLERELNRIQEDGYEGFYLRMQAFAQRVREDGIWMEQRSSIGASFVMWLLSVTPINPLPAHYVCPVCKNTIFPKERAICGADLPHSTCLVCGADMRGDGFDIPPESYMGSDARREKPNAEIHFPEDYVQTACSIWNAAAPEEEQTRTFGDFAALDSIHPRPFFMGNGSYWLFRKLAEETGIDPQTIPLNNSLVLRSLREGQIQGRFPYGTAYFSKILSKLRPQSFGELVRVFGFVTTWFNTGEEHEGKVINDIVATDCINEDDDWFLLPASREEIIALFIKKGLPRDEAYLLTRKIMHGAAKRGEMPPEWEDKLLAHGISKDYIAYLKKIEIIWPKTAHVTRAWFLYCTAWYRLNFPKLFERLLREQPADDED